jgi:septum formation topological specificity factor MinE
MPVYAASRRDDDSRSGLLDRLQKKIVQVIKRVVRPLDDFIPTVTKP